MNRYGMSPAWWMAYLLDTVELGAVQRLQVQCNGSG